MKLTLFLLRAYSLVGTVLNKQATTQFNINFMGLTLNKRECPQLEVVKKGERRTSEWLQLKEAGGWGGGRG